jgi:hypothetical protein
LIIDLDDNNLFRIFLSPAEKIIRIVDNDKNVD